MAAVGKASLSKSQYYFCIRMDEKYFVLLCVLLSQLKSLLLGELSLENMCKCCVLLSSFVLDLFLWGMGEFAGTEYRKKKYPY